MRLWSTGFIVCFSLEIVSWKTHDVYAQTLNLGERCLKKLRHAIAPHLLGPSFTMQDDVSEELEQIKKKIYIYSYMLAC